MSIRFGSRRSGRTLMVAVALVAVALAVAGCHSTAPDPHLSPTVASSGAMVSAEVDRKSVALFDQALDAIRDGRYAQAEPLLLELTTRDPLLSGPWVNLGAVYESLGDDAAAERAFNKAIETNPDNCAAYVDLGVLKRKVGDFQAAETNYLACVQRVPDYREAYLNLGILYELYLGRLDDALTAYQRYQSLSASPDLRVSGWVSDLERRLASNES